MVRKIPCVFCIIFLVCQPTQSILGHDQQEWVKSVIRASRIKEKAENLGIGALVNVTLRSSQKQKGRIVEIAEDSLGLAIEKRTINVQFSDVADLNLVHPHYKANGQLDATRVRQVVSDLGLGQEITLKLISKNRLMGHIRSIDSDSFTIVDSRTGEAIPVFFNEVSMIEKSKVAYGKPKMLLRFGIGFAIAAALFAVASCASGQMP